MYIAKLKVLIQNPVCNESLLLVVEYKTELKIKTYIWHNTKLQLLDWLDIFNLLSTT